MSELVLKNEGFVRNGENRIASGKCPECGADLTDGGIKTKSIHHGLAELVLKDDGFWIEYLDDDILQVDELSCLRCKNVLQTMVRE